MKEKVIEKGRGDEVGEKNIRKEEMREAVRKLNDGKAGMDGIPKKNIKVRRKRDRVVDLEILYQSMEEGWVTKKLEKRQIIPIIKKGSGEKVENYKGADLDAVGIQDLYYNIVAP